MGAAAIPLMLAGTAASMYGGYRSSQSQAANQEYQAKIEKYNADIARRQAEIEGAQSAQRENLVRSRGRQVIAMQRAGMMEAGVGSVGSALDVHGASVVAAEVDALNVRYEGTLKRLSLLSDAAVKDANARMLKKSAKDTRSAGWISMFGTAAQGAGSAAYMSSTMPTKTPALGSSSTPYAGTNANLSMRAPLSSGGW